MCQCFLIWVHIVCNIGLVPANSCLNDRKIDIKIYKHQKYQIFISFFPININLGHIKEMYYVIIDSY